MTVHGMAAKNGNLIHADRHGAVVVPVDKISAMRGALNFTDKEGSAHHRGSACAGRERGDYQGRHERMSRVPHCS